MRILFTLALLLTTACSTVKLTNAEKLEIKKENQRARIQKDRN
jgi:hypothetical protein